MNPNNSLNDILPPNSGNGGSNGNNNNSGGETSGPKKSIRNIPLSDRKQNKIDELLKETADFRVEHPTRVVESSPRPATPAQTKIKSSPSLSSGGKGTSRKALWLVALVAVLVLAGGLLMIFNNAEVRVTLKTESIPVNMTAAAVADEMSATDTLPYKLLPLQKEENKEIAATGPTTKVEKKASGTIIVYNNFSAASQQLIATTRFETPAGLVYRIDKPITVPGTTVVNGKTVPGSVEAVVYADQSGTSYNISNSDFTIPGFKGTTKYEGFYARTKTALSGGFSGTTSGVSDADLKTANEELEQSLTGQIMTEIQSQKPAGYVFLKDGIRTAYTSSVGASSDGKATVTGRMSAEVLLFETSTLEKMIAENTGGSRYHFDNLDSLGLTIENGDKITSFISSPALSLTFAGTLTTGQSFEEEALKTALSGKAKIQLQEIMKMYPEITKAEATVRPFWSRTFPNNPQKIKVIVTKEE
jgi:hypothetical protein